MSCLNFLFCGKCKTEIDDFRKSVRMDAAEVNRRKKEIDEITDELENKEKKYDEILDELIRPRTSIDNKSLTKRQTENRRKTVASGRTTILEEPLLEQLCEMSDIEPNHLLYDTMTNAERRSLVTHFGANPNTAEIFETKEALNEFVTNNESSRTNSILANEPPRMSRQRPSALSSVSANMVGRRAGADIRWETIRSSIRESKRNKLRNSANSAKRRSDQTVDGSLDAVFKDLIEDIVNHRESQMQRKRQSDKISLQVDMLYMCDVRPQDLTKDATEKLSDCI